MHRPACLRSVANARRQDQSQNAARSRGGLRNCARDRRRCLTARFLAMMEASGTEVLFELVDDHIAIVTLNRPDKRNAVNAALALALDRIVKRVEEEDH